MIAWTVPGATWTCAGAGAGAATGAAGRGVGRGVATTCCTRTTGGAVGAGVASGAPSSGMWSGAKCPERTISSAPAGIALVLVRAAVPGRNVAARTGAAARTLTPAMTPRRRAGKRKDSFSILFNRQSRHEPRGSPHEATGIAWSRSTALLGRWVSVPCGLVTQSGRRCLEDVEVSAAVTLATLAQAPQVDATRSEGCRGPL